MIGFAFDIDGVLLRGNRILPSARKALEKLNNHKIPWILLTNGGGMLESKRCADLSDKLGVRISKHQLLQSHTPFKDMVGSTDRILAVGGKQNSVKAIAEAYGFKDVVVPSEIVANMPGLHPFPSWTSKVSKNVATAKMFDVHKPYDAIFVFQDSYDISVDSQLVIDLLLSEKGQLGTRRLPETFTKSPTVPIYFSNADLQWATDYSIPRFGQGAFMQTVLSLYKAVTNGCDLKHTVIGKPTSLTYQYASKLLEEWAASNQQKIDTVFMIGDNQYSDIKGANAYGWESVLVKSGVYKDADTLFTKPTYIEDDVLSAVNKVLE